MGPAALTIATLLYAVIAVDNLIKKDYPHALIWGAYCIANLGFLWHELTRPILQN